MAISTIVLDFVNKALNQDGWVIRSVQRNGDRAAAITSFWFELEPSGSFKIPRDDLLHRNAVDTLLSLLGSKDTILQDYAVSGNRITLCITERTIMGFRPDPLPFIPELPETRRYFEESEATVLEPVTGYRDFGVDLINIEEPLIISRNGTIWIPRQEQWALCRDGKHYDAALLISHDPPHPHCECGIYAFDKPDHSSLKVSTAPVWGEVALWGDVLICESGYRAQFGYPTALFVRDMGTRLCRKVCEGLEKNYGVPAFLVKNRDNTSIGQALLDEITAWNERG